MVIQTITRTETETKAIELIELIESTSTIPCVTRTRIVRALATIGMIGMIATMQHVIALLHHPTPDAAHDRLHRATMQDDAPDRGLTLVRQEHPLMEL